MSSVQHFVSPKLPTTLANDTHVYLPGYDLWIIYVNTVHVVPAELDVPEFKEALSRVLQVYSHAAGQLRCTNGRWSIELTNTPIPVDVDYKLDMNPGSLLQDNWVVQHDLSPFLHQQPVSTNLINGSAPLLRVKLTFFKRETYIGVSWNHILGDGIMMSRFMHTLSQFYQGLPSEFPTPTFKKHDFPTSSHPVTAEFSPAMLPCPTSRQTTNVEQGNGLAHVRWLMNEYDLEKLRAALGTDKQNKNLLSKQDCLTAYLVTVLNCNRTNPVQRLINISSYRHIRASFIAENAASNLIIDVPVNVPTDMAGIATAIRGALIQYRDPYYIYNMVALQNKHFLETRNGGKPNTSPFNPYEMTVNSNVAIDWRGAHFGCADGTRFHIGGVHKHYWRCFRANPEKGDDGVWRARQSVEISMGVPAELKPKIMETLAHGVQYMLDSQRVRS